ncbi:MAG: rRNA pseudouridine synthase [Lachnospiraceae bacterium]|nr:rRNA pseudouridine synthase [Lachnospiraceae bacterium]
MRIDKFLSDAGFGTRKEVRILVKKGAVSVNGKAVTDAGAHIDCDWDAITVYGEPVVYQRFRYYMMNKPSGVVSATEDGRERTVLDLLPPALRKGLFPVGRLDKDTTGLLLLTDDGALAHCLLSPKKHVDKTYLVTYDGKLPSDVENLFANGLRVDETFRALPAKLVRLSECEAYVTIREGKYHQVKRMFAAVGCRVTALRRISMGTLALDETLREGDFRELYAQELTLLRSNS